MGQLNHSSGEVGSASDSRFELDSPVLLATAALALWGLAGCARLRLIDHCAVGSDSLGPYLAALSASWSHLPHPPNPESGDALWWMENPAFGRGQTEHQ